MNLGGESLVWIVGMVVLVAILVLVFAFSLGPAQDGNATAGGIAVAIIKVVPVVVVIGIIGLIVTLVGGRGKRPS